MNQADISGTPTDKGIKFILGAGMIIHILRKKMMIISSDRNKSSTINSKDHSKEKFISDSSSKQAMFKKNNHNIHSDESTDRMFYLVP